MGPPRLRPLSRCGIHPACDVRTSRTRPNRHAQARSSGSFSPRSTFSPSPQPCLVNSLRVSAQEHQQGAPCRNRGLRMGPGWLWFCSARVCGGPAVQLVEECSSLCPILGWNSPDFRGGTVHQRRDSVVGGKGSPNPRAWTTCSGPRGPRPISGSRPRIAVRESLISTASAAEGAHRRVIANVRQTRSV